ncbi:uncharacterized protein B0H18DRAFT_1215475 [Fomitopsis serialis]|uniref:uncharacterized protein n=1 Tax=Fomitopsis serialis TaxID=139415 RepID=UPI002007312F|nr:uncharacterized protein B0H18DRAFT_1215475 [Neoantrodia serialis]KAH9915526.1 hypothetical protein B0H18DRAFT_1215475 [Neoantrodia serialis]
MPQPQACRIPLELVDEIFQKLPPQTRHLFKHHKINKDEAHWNRVALARCAHVCRAFHESAVRVLWKDLELGAFLEAVLRSLDYGAVKWPERHQDDWGGGDASDDEDNEDVAVGVEPERYLYSYKYLPGPISAEEWARFTHYAAFVRILRYAPFVESIDPTLFFFLQQHAQGTPLFPNLHELVWSNATPEVLAVISPSIRLLDLTESNDDDYTYAEMREFSYRARRHALKALLPTILRGAPNLEELRLRTMGHEVFWFPLQPAPGDWFFNRNIRVLHISESCRAVMRAALTVISTMKELLELGIRLVESGPTYDLEDDDLSDVRTFENLKHLEIWGEATGVATLVDAIVAPNLEDVEIIIFTGPEDSDPSMVEAELSTIFKTLPLRNAATLRRLRLSIWCLCAPLFPSEVSTDPSFSTVARPLLELRRLQDVCIDQRVRRGALNVSASALAAAWPALRALALPEVIVSPNALRAIARTCPRLEQLKVKALSPEFHYNPSRLVVDDSSQPTITADSHSDLERPALRELCVDIPLKAGFPDTPGNIIRFLNTLFPQLVIRRPEDLVKYDPTGRGG